MKLDLYQEKAAYQDFPYSFILAGAGTGKTYTLLGRINYLVTKLGMKPEEILVISYTNETVKDFQRKLKDSLGYRVEVLTFHKLALFLLKQAETEYFLVDDNMLEFIVTEFLESYCVNNLLLSKKLRALLPFSGLFMKTVNIQNYLKSVKKDFIRFIKLYCSKGLNSKDLLNFYSMSSKKDSAFLLLSYIIIQLYESEKTSQCLIDFDDLIVLSYHIIDSLPYFSYRHILVDEFQDSSLIRMNLFQKLVKKFHLNFTVVGDDCQSIYRFSGTESDCFSLLQSFFPELKTFYLKYTYRNSQELIDIANRFVLKNPYQLKKEICSFFHLSFPVELLYYRFSSQIFSMLKYIITQSDEDILFLVRNSYDWKYYFNANDMIWEKEHYFKLKAFGDRKFRFMTVHKSKGLESSIVIILHASNEPYGFPNSIKNRSYMKYILSKDNYPLEEERRLFYVALTRARKKVFILVPIASPSIFIKELTKRKNYKIKKRFF